MKIQKNYLPPAPGACEKFNSKLYDWVPMIYMTANISINMVIFVRLYNTRKFFVQKKKKLGRKKGVRDIRRRLYFDPPPPAAAAETARGYKAA